MGLTVIAMLEAGFFSSWTGWGFSAVILLAVLGGSLGLAFWGLRSSAQGQLRWDGEHWHWSAEQDFGVTELSCVLGLQHFLILRMHLDNGVKLWLWLESGSMAEGWMALRRAVVANKPASEPTAFNSLPQ
jgi:hypothetical protein